MPFTGEDETSSNGRTEVVDILVQIRSSLEANLKLQDERISRLESCLTTLASEPEMLGSNHGQHKRELSSSRITNHLLDTVEPVEEAGTVEELVPYEGISPWIKILNTFKRTPKWLLGSPENFLSRLQQETWIPEDGRFGLSFTIDRLCSCSSMTEVGDILQDLHDFNQSLTANGGYFLLRDSDLQGNSKYFTNYQRGHNPREYSLPPYPYMHWGFEKVVPVSTKSFQVPPRRWISKNGELYGGEPVAPWRRLCIIDNLARTYVNGNQDKQAKVLPFRFSRELNDLLSTNLTRSQFFGADHGRNKWAKHSHKVQTGFRIQYSWYEVQHRHSTARFESLMSSDEIPHAGWHAGLLYDDPDRRRYGQVTFTIMARFGFQSPLRANASDTITLDQAGHFWTIIVLGNEFILPHYALQPMEFCAQVFCLRLSVRVLRSILRSARDLADHLKHLLEAGAEAILDPSRHDSLLFDDEAFSRSRKYFWAVDSVQDFRTTLSETLKVFKEFWDHQVEPMKTGILPSEWPHGLEEAEKEAEELKEKLELVLAQFEVQHSRAEVLRSGLFDASSVIEARSSTRLSEHIKLLTYISIFYLPLAFSTSLWSTTSFFQKLDTATMFVVMTIVAAVTYIAVFNLDYLVHFFNKGYRTFRKAILMDMERSNNEKWKARRDQYVQFKPQVQRLTVSEWYIAMYAISRLFTRLWQWLSKTLHRAYIKSPFYCEGVHNRPKSLPSPVVSSIRNYGTEQDGENIAAPLKAITLERYGASAPHLNGRISIPRDANIVQDTEYK